MARRRTSPTERERYMKEFRASGLTQREFAARLGVPVSTVATWAQRSADTHHRTDTSLAMPARFLEVNAAEDVRGMSLELVLVQGHRLRVQGLPPAGWVAELVRLLSC